MRSVHSFSGFILLLFIALHVLNHSISIWGAEYHIQVMNKLRVLYRNPVAESLLLLAVLVQVLSGMRLFMLKRKIADSGFDKLQLYSGLYLAFFLVIHLSAVFVGRLILKLDTNFYFGVAGLNSFPTNLFFIPYYGLAMMALFGHLSAVHYRKMSATVFGLTPLWQARLMIVTGLLLTLFIFYGLTNHFRGVTIPESYRVLIGK